MVKNEISFSCPHCGRKIRVQFDGSGYPTAFLLEETEISRLELSERYGIELGVVVEGGE